MPGGRRKSRGGRVHLQTRVDSQRNPSRAVFLSTVSRELAPMMRVWGSRKRYPPVSPGTRALARGLDRVPIQAESRTSSFLVGVSPTQPRGVTPRGNLRNHALWEFRDWQEDSTRERMGKNWFRTGPRVWTRSNGLGVCPIACPDRRRTSFGAVDHPTTPPGKDRPNWTWTSPTRVLVPWFGGPQHA